MNSIAEFTAAVTLGVALAACAGLRAWLPLFMAGAMSRAGWFELGSSFEFVGSDQALVLFGLATVLEIGADKVPALDNLLDGISTVARPAAGTLLAATTLGTVTDPLAAWVLGAVVGAPSALVPHAAKTGVRLASTVFTAGLANPVVSVLEDVASVVLFVLALVVPAVVCLLLAAACFYLVRSFLRRREAPAT